MNTRIDYRRPGTEDPPPVLWWRQRWALLATAIVLVTALLVIFAGSSSALLLASLAFDLPLLALWLAAAAGFGSLVPMPPTPSGGGLRTVSRLALGLGAVGLIQLGLGLAGQLHGTVAWTLIGLGVVVLIFRCRKLRAQHMNDWLTAPADWDWLWLAILPVLAMSIVAAYVPPGALWGDEPHGYDVLEYHLQLPREWYELHRIVPLHHNVFSYFPLGVEMHDLLAMQLRGGPWNGMYLAQLMHVMFIVLTIGAIYSVARQFADKFPSLLAAIAAAYVPWMALLAPVAYNEGGLLLFGTLAIGWLIHARSLAEWWGDEIADRLALSRRPWVIGGAMAGLACGAKLTAVPSVLLIPPLMMVLTARFARRRQPRLFGGCAAYIACGLLVFSPWLVRNMVWTGNPVFPEAQRLLGRAHFSETQTQRWERAHSPPPEQRSLRARGVAARGQILFDWRYGWVLLPLTPWVCFECKRRPQAALLVTLLIAWLIFWLGFTHLQGRFFVLAIPVAALALALPKYRWQQYEMTLFSSIALVGMMLGLWRTHRQFNERVAVMCDNQMLGFDNFRQLLPPDVESILDRPEPIALVGDAKAFLYRVPMSRLRYRTVFDVDVRPGQSVVAAWVQGQTGPAYIVVDPLELQRFARTYYGIPPIGDDVPGPRDRVFILAPQGR